MHARVTVAGAVVHIPRGAKTRLVTVAGVRADGARDAVTRLNSLAGGGREAMRRWARGSRSGGAEGYPATDRDDAAGPTPGSGPGGCEACESRATPSSPAVVCWPSDGRGRRNLVPRYQSRVRFRYRGTRPALISRRHAAISRTHSTSVRPTAVHSRLRLPILGRSRRSYAHCSQCSASRTSTLRDPQGCKRFPRVGGTVRFLESTERDRVHKAAGNGEMSSR